ncbi:hypothetical protein Patl1_35029 [Pistacia atlantica]|uniref:Uncharacterized protein n=1 Tax=Pistacia atlantica TaxID=434234 RepID=A0ACC0ZVZ1_9ROSI|nr:hypothetical protein Patl1_35029 [Pistacia atlantica]
MDGMAVGGGGGDFGVSGGREERGCGCGCKKNKTMSYLPPHLRNSTSNSMSKASPTNSSVATLNTDHSKLSFSSNSNSVASFSNAFRRTAAAQTLPEPFFATWKPSDRILRLQPQ